MPTARDLYRHLHARITSLGPGLIAQRFPDDGGMRMALNAIVRLLPDPTTASREEIRFACQLCSSGPLENFYGEFGAEAREILNLPPGEFGDDGPPPPPPPIPAGNADLNAIAVQLNYISPTSAAAARAASNTFTAIRDIIYKGRCRECSGDLLVTLEGSRLLIECKAQRSAACRGKVFELGQLRPA